MCKVNLYITCTHIKNSPNCRKLNIIILLTFLCLARSCFDRFKSVKKCASYTYHGFLPYLLSKRRNIQIGPPELWTSGGRLPKVDAIFWSNLYKVWNSKSSKRCTCTHVVFFKENVLRFEVKWINQTYRHKISSKSFKSVCSILDFGQQFFVVFTAFPFFDFCQYFYKSMSDDLKWISNPLHCPFNPSGLFENMT